MDKEEYRQKLNELTGYVRDKDFDNARRLADEIDWRRVKSLNTLNMVADIYEVSGDYERTKEILEIALGRASIGHSILYRLVEVCLKLGETDEAERYFNEFSRTAKNDNSRCILQYKLYKAKNAPLEAQIDVLEEYREKEYTERWAYELALLYSKAGDRKKCLDACDDLILWFGEGRYVLKAMELKKKYEPLSPSQEQAYERMKAAYRKPGSGEAADTDADEDASSERDASDRAVTYGRYTADIPGISGGSSDESGKAAAGYKASGAPEADNLSASKNVDAPAGNGAVTKEASAPSDSGKGADGSDQGALKDRISRNFRSFFGQTGDKESEDKKDEETVSDSGKSSGTEETSGGTGDFDLNAFLNETAGSFSNEIHGTDFNTGRSTVTQDTVDTPAEAAVNAELDSLNSAKSVTPGTNGADGANTAMPQDADRTGDAETGASDAGYTEITPQTDAGSGLYTNDTGKQQAQTGTPAEDKMQVQTGTAADENTQAAAGSMSVADAIAGLTSVSSESGDKASDNARGSVPAEKAPAENAGQAAESAEKPSSADPDSEKTSSGDNDGSVSREKPKPHYIEELEVPDPEPTEEEKKAHTHTIPLDTIGENTIPISIDKILQDETPEERRIRILNKAKPNRMSEDQRNIFTYFARIPGMDGQILEAMNGVYQHAGERTSLHGNIAIMGARGTGKSRLARGLVVAMCKDLGMDAAKVARISGKKMNSKDPAKVVSMMAGGFLIIEDISDIDNGTLQKLNQAMEFRTDCMVLIIEDEKTRMRSFLKEHPQFAGKFEKVISIPVFTNDELVTFARTYATENGCKIDDMAILALYTMIGNIQSEEEPTTISTVKEIIDSAILKATKGRRRKVRGDEAERTGRWLILHEKDFAV